MTMFVLEATENSAVLKFSQILIDLMMKQKKIIRV